jgi:hypothetical protein
MGYVTYTARRKLAPGHSVGINYTLPITISRMDYVGRDLKIKQVSLNGSRMTNYYGRDDVWRVTFEPVSESEANLMREFIASTADGQLFQFDPKGTESAPIQLMTVMRDDEGASVTERIRDVEQGFIQYAIDIVEQ